MSDAVLGTSAHALRSRDKRQHWARPRSRHDKVVKTARIVLPSLIGALAAVLVMAPLIMRSEVSFVLDKDKVEVAKERMRVSEALYRGEDAEGRAFALRAGSAVQKTSRVPVVELNELTGRIALDDGPATLRAPRASYDMDAETVRVNGPIVVEASDGYRIATRDVGIDLKQRTLASDAPVSGKMPLGTFSANRMLADLNARSVVLVGRARLRIVQGASRGR